MKLNKIDKINIKIPKGIESFIQDANIYDSSSSEDAKVYFIDKEEGYFLKCQDKGKLQLELILTKYFNSKGISTEVVKFISEEKD